MAPTGSPGRRRSFNIVALAILVLAIAVVARSHRGPLHTYGASVQRVVLTAGGLGERLPVTLVRPAGAPAGRPLLVLLSPDPEDPGGTLSSGLFAALHDLGGSAPTLALPGGPARAYTGADAGAWRSYLLRVVIPAASSKLDANPRRVAIGGVGAGGPVAASVVRSASASLCGAALTGVRTSPSTEAAWRQYLGVYANALARCRSATSTA